MSIVAPVTVAWQRVTNESKGQAKEIETFSQLEPAIRRARDVILSTKDTQNPKFTGSDPEAHLTLHPGDFKYGDALTQQDLDNIYITILPGAVTQDASETFPPDSTTNVADLNSFASRVFFAEAEDEFIFDSNVTVRGDFSFQGNILTFKLDGDVQAGFRVEDVSTNRSSSITYNIADEEWNVGDDARIDGQLHSDSLRVDGKVDIRGNFETFETTDVGSFNLSGQTYLLDVDSQITESGAFYTADIDNKYSVLSKNFDIQADEDGKVEATNGLLELIGAEIGIESTSGNVDITSADSFNVDTVSGASFDTGGTIFMNGGGYQLTSPSASINVDDYNISSDSVTATVNDEFRIASGGPNASFVVEPPVNFGSGFELSGDTTVDDLTVNGKLLAKSSPKIDLNATGDMTVDAANYAMNVSTADLFGSEITITGTQLLSLQSENQIDISAQGQGNTQVDISGDDIKINPQSLATFDGATLFNENVSLASGALLDVAGNGSIGGNLEAGEVYPQNISSGNVTFAGPQGQIEDDSNKTFAYDTVTGTLTVGNVDASGGTVESDEIIANSADIGNISLQNASFNSISAQSANLADLNVAGMAIGEVPYLDNSGHLAGSSNLTYDPATGTLQPFAIDVLQDISASNVSLNGFLQLQSGTSVNKIKTEIEPVTSSNDALVTEGALLEALQGGGSRTFGQAVFSGDGTKTQFSIQHGLESPPTSWQVFPGTDDASSFSHATADGSEITVYYDSAPPSGTNNVALNWRVTDGSDQGEDGQAAFSADGSTTEFQIPHGISSKPDVWQVTPNSEDATLISNVTADSSNLTVKFDSAPPGGTENVEFTWKAKQAGSLSGQATFSGNGTKTQFQIPHGVGEKPSTWKIEAVSPDATQPSHASADSSNITVFYDSPPPSGTNNVTLNWAAKEKVGSTELVNTVQGGTDIKVNKTTGDVVVSHSNTGGAKDNSDSATFLNEITLDDRGHVESLGFDTIVSANTGISEDDTEILSSTGDINFVASNDANVDVRDDGDGTATVDIDVITTDFNSDNYVEVAGDTMNGELTIDDSLSVSQDVSIGGNLVGTNSFRDLFVDSGAPSGSEGEDGDVWFETGTAIVESISTGSGLFNDQQTGDVTLSHGATSSVSDSVDSSTAITGLTFDQFGHVQTLSTGKVGIDVEDGGTTVLTGTNNINFGAGLDAIDDGDGTITAESDISEFNTDSLPEGSNNLYYESSRVKDEFEAAGDLTYTKYPTDGYDIANATYTTTLDVTSEDDQLPSGIAFNNDGTKLFMCGDEDDNIYEYNLSTGFDLSTASYSNTSFDVSGETIGPSGITFNNDGTKLFLSGEFDGNIYEYNLTTGFDLSTASYSGTSFDVSTEDDEPKGLTFNNDGSKMLVCEGSGNVFEYGLNTSFDLSTASYTGTSFDTNSDDANPHGIAFSEDGTEMIVVEGLYENVHKYNLGTPFDISTANYTGENLDITSRENSPKSIAFSTNGAKMFISGSQNDSIYEYDVSGSGSNKARFSIDVSEVSDLLSSSTTDDLIEGSTNEYFTDERAQDAVATALVGGDDIQFTYNDSQDEITADFTGTSGIGIEDDGDEVLSKATSVNFGKAIAAEDGGGGTAKVGLDGDFSRAVLSGDGAKKEFQISHGLNEKPAYWIVNSTSEDGSGISHVTADDTNITVKYDTPPPSGSDNIILNWLAMLGNVAPQWESKGDLEYAK